MEPEKFDVEITISHADELRKIDRKKFDKLLDKFHYGLMDFPGVGSVCGPRVEATPDEVEQWDRIEQEGKVRRQQEIGEALASVLKDPRMKELVKSQVESLFNTPEYKDRLVRAVDGSGSS